MRVRRISVPRRTVSSPTVGSAGTAEPTEALSEAEARHREAPHLTAAVRPPGASGNNRKQPW